MGCKDSMHSSNKPSIIGSIVDIKTRNKDVTITQLRTDLATTEQRCSHWAKRAKDAEAQLKAAKEDAKHDLKMAKRVIKRKEKFADKTLNLSEILAVENNNLKKANTKLKEALEKHRWIPVSERLPENTFKVWVCNTKIGFTSEDRYIPAVSRWESGRVYTHWKPITLP